jgi:hypothetical protein
LLRIHNFTNCKDKADKLKPPQYQELPHRYIPNRHYPQMVTLLAHVSHSSLVPVCFQATLFHVIPSYNFFNVPKAAQAINCLIGNQILANEMKTFITVSG